MTDPHGHGVYIVLPQSDGSAHLAAYGRLMMGEAGPIVFACEAHAEDFAKGLVAERQERLKGEKR